MNTKTNLLILRSTTLHGEDKFEADVQIAMRLLRSDVMSDRCELPAWLTAHLDACKGCGGERSWFHKPFDSDVWTEGHSTKGGQGWHGCVTCSGGPS